MSTKKLASGLDQNLAAALSYAGVWITGLVFFLLEKDNQFVRFHALQSIVFFGTLTILSLIPVVGWLLSPILWIFGFVVWLICLVKAYQGEEFLIPLIGPFVKKKLKTMV
jgi:uncharacterized membrane protein